MSKTEKIIPLISKSENAKMHTPKMCLEGCLETDIGKRGAFKNGEKLIILALDTSDGNYKISWCQAGMRSSEMVALLDIAKNVIKEDMGY